MKQSRITGWFAFRVLWAGQAVSLLGSGMTRFAFLIWAYQKTGEATALALLGFSTTLAYILASPFAGVLADRLDRKRVMFFADLAAGCMTALLLGLSIAGKLQLWQVYLAEGIAGASLAFQEPAFFSSMSLIVPKDGLTRANAMLGLGRSASTVFAPILGGLLLQSVGLNAVMIADLGTLVLGLGALLLVPIPSPAASDEGRKAAGSFLHEMGFGLQYIFKRSSLRDLMGTFFLINLFGTLTYMAVLSPMILARAGGDEITLGIVRTMMGIGGIAGGLVLTIWGFSKQKARTYGWSTMISFFICDFLTAISRSLPGWATAGFLSELSIPFIVSPYYALWQEIVPGDIQGRVFATREMVQVISQPVGYLAGGLLADRLFEPALAHGGVLAGSAGLLVGTGPGAGMAAMFLCTSVLGGLTGLLALTLPSIRRLDQVVQEGLPASQLVN
ncbi:MAG TPA: MFS transporter [Anaerolineaceae bacterium]|nr:MFS transporter [Anaerolineaceae bacterium]